MAPICAEGRNCWRIAPAQQVSFLVDAAAYYETLAKAAEKAKHALFILSWDIHGLIRLRRDRPAETLRSFLLTLLDKTPALHIYILNWAFPLVYADDRELLPLLDHPWHSHPRLHFRWDRHHPMGACHHEKIVVIDDQLAFCGGLDLADERWDMSCHRPNDRRRRGLRRSCYKPFHDVTIMVEGKAAECLGQLARERWQHAGGKMIPPCVPAPPSAWPDSVVPDMRHVNVSIARTRPMYAGHREIREVQSLFEDALRAARHTIYIENQYFTSQILADMILERLQAIQGPEIIIVLPQGFTGQMEKASFGVLRARQIRRLLAQDPYHRLHFYYPTAPHLLPGDYIKVHSKLMIVDDSFLRIGSANLCNRSLGMDTECDLAIEASDLEGQRTIASLRHRLLAEHLETTPAEIARHFGETGSLAQTIQRCCRSDRCLVPFAGEGALCWETLIPDTTLIDPERPLKLESMISRKLAQQGMMLPALTRLIRLAPFIMANLVAFPLLGFWLLTKRVTKGMILKVQAS